MKQVDHHQRHQKEQGANYGVEQKLQGGGTAFVAGAQNQEGSGQRQNLVEDIEHQHVLGEKNTEQGTFHDQRRQRQGAELGESPGKGHADR